MADVSAPRRVAGAGERAQLMLVTALVLASLFVVLAMVLNAVIFTENFATRTHASEDVRDALSTRDVAAAELDRALADANRHDTSYADLHDAFGREVTTWGTLAARHRAANARDLDLAVVDVTNGTRIVQRNASRTLTNVSGAPDWELVDDADGLQAAALNVSRSSLVVPSNETNSTALVADGVFHVVLTDAGGDAWRVFVYRDGVDAVEVRVQEPTGTLRPACSAAAGADGTVTVDLVAGSVGGTDCPELAFVDGLSPPADLAFRAGDGAAGTYVIVVAQLEGVIDGDGDFAAVDDGASPATTETIYAATVEVRYVSSVVEYRTTLRVFPEAPDA